jgi:type II secretory ATPase GspE/PulE/Tfp pilus assembly ATPase PilB-like protein
MIRRLLAKIRQSGTPVAAPGLRQATEAPAIRNVAATDQPGTGVGKVIAFEPAHHAETDAPKHIHITDIADVPAWRSIVPNVVRKGDIPSCVVLDLQMRSALVLGTPEFFASSAHSALIHELVTGQWKVESERTCSPGVIAAVRSEAHRRGVAGVDVADQNNVGMYKDINSTAYTLRASDIHIRLNLHLEQSQIRLRIDGKLRHWKYFDTKVLLDALSAGYQSLTIKGTNSDPQFTTERPINTITRFEHNGVRLHGRMSTQPTTAGCKVVIRVIDASPDALVHRSLLDLGFTQQQVEEDLYPAMTREKGFILVSGSTGDGKTTSLQHMLANLPDRDSKCLMGVEDPNEMEVPDMDHISIQRSPDDSVAQMRMKYDAALVQMLRMDPDVVMQGEIRDRVSAEFASDIVMTGHLLMLTGHGNSALGTIFRLMGRKIDIAPEVLTDIENFAVSMAQKLLPLLCEECKVPAHQVMAPRELAILRTRYHLDTTAMFCAKTGGCEHCRPGPDMVGDGEKGRVAAAEIIANPTQEFLDLVLAKNKRGAELSWRRTRRAAFNHPDMRGKTSFEAALYWVSQGRVSPLALQRVFGKHFSQVEIIDIPVSVKDVA